MTDDFITGLMKGAGGARGAAAYVAVEYDKQGNAVSISGLPDFAQKYVNDTITALRAEVERLRADAANAYEKGLQDALRVIASLEYGMSEGVDEGHEKAFRAVQKHLADWRAALTTKGEADD
jgi:hypothetical protein